MTILQKYHWPGNIRELENLVKRYVILGNEEAISGDLVTREQEYFNPDLNLDGPISLKKLTRQAVRELERKVILKVLQANHWNRKQAARALSISYRALLYKIRDAGLPSNRTSRRRRAKGQQVPWLRDGMVDRSDHGWDGINLDRCRIAHGIASAVGDRARGGLLSG